MATAEGDSLIADGIFYRLRGALARLRIASGGTSPIANVLDTWPVVLSRLVILTDTARDSGAPEALESHIFDLMNHNTKVMSALIAEWPKAGKKRRHKLIDLLHAEVAELATALSDLTGVVEGTDDHGTVIWAKDGS
ncbi:hypothetical protein J3A64_004781 [Pseudarthrobacter sp. PvP004]|uniref:hypothetical protein n=1 Tax=Pseudarthrobacter sp. PvP004 TaxID=2817850 RepID=UPI001AE4FA65|nr:hypothetical protein [Pseudarthrobacter sp. PvP004]MBP2269241.1 hypothetical protein [Pseudarthrobacter sp. PvP004]